MHKPPSHFPQPASPFDGIEQRIFESLASHGTRLDGHDRDVTRLTYDLQKQGTRIDTLLYSVIGVLLTALAGVAMQVFYHLHP